MGTRGTASAPEESARLANAQDHIPELDALRGIASFGVVLFHAFPRIFFFGWSFVDCFFVLSGYLITSILLRNLGSARLLPAFYFRRALRIWPVYYLTLAVVLFLNAHARTGWPTTGLAQYLFFCQNLQHLWGGNAPAFIVPFLPSWSVAVEEQFYLCWPIVLVVFGARAVRPIAAGLVVIATAYQIARMPIDTVAYRADALAAGCLLASLNLRAPDAGLMKVLGVVGVLAAAVILGAAVFWWADPDPPPWGYVILPAFSAFYASVIGFSVRYSGHRFLAPLRSKPLRNLGLISYSLYLLHLPIFTYGPAVLARVGVTGHARQQWCEWIAIFVMPILSYRFVERPALSLKRLLGYSVDRGSRL
jgi:peptidoglycan/LPS O-acetylase OafA/YrhL